MKTCNVLYDDAKLLFTWAPLYNPSKAWTAQRPAWVNPCVGAWEFLFFHFFSGKRKKVL